MAALVRRTAATSRPVIGKVVRRMTIRRKVILL
jgi:hypothetical protein